MTTSELADAVKAALLSDYLALYLDKREELDAGREAFAALLAHMSAVEAENAALRAFVGIPDGVTVASVENIMALPLEKLGGTSNSITLDILRKASRVEKPVITVKDSE